MVFAESYSHVQKQEQRVTASMIQGLNMLSLPAQAMYDYLVELSMANPMLDIPEPRALEAYAALRGPGENFTAIEAGRDPAYYDNYSRSGADADEDFDPYYSKGVDLESEALAGSLKLQLSMCRLSPVEEAIGLEIIGDLDESGYFTGSLETICLLYCQSLEWAAGCCPLSRASSPEASPRQTYTRPCAFRWMRPSLWGLGKAHSSTRTFRPFATPAPPSAPPATMSPRAACAGVRLYTQSGTPARQLRRAAITDKLYRAGHRRGAQGRRAAHLCLRRGDNPLTINDYYLHLLDQPELNAEEKHYLRQSLNSAKALIHSVDIRRQTLSRAAHALVALQRDFFPSRP